ncbi:RcgA family putative transporter [Paracoccus laeviglucosivorans]|uniref:Transmembrane protein n=1 Tax=Paracoccus laeviglucosivorans TaxID=1197861 RepID=A0A521FUW3_9RHOB|nr:hypothetical protein [Paracoccus laeviglucosivorans]SMO99957.1 hypothetical protein SAMN06265221_1532 [Paracoccus laeviglucosivorans]
MNKNGKIFLPPPKDECDFKELFRQVVAVGAGRPVGKDNFPVGPWTPELLADAISSIPANRAGIELRTVQLWFQENDKGISVTNMRWLARVLGCDDPLATKEWQLALGLAHSRLLERRRKQKRGGAEAVEPAVERPTLELRQPQEKAAGRDGDHLFALPRRSLARWSEALFCNGSHLDLPASVFAGAVALVFLSYVLGVHSASYATPSGVEKQVGFIWAPNWTLLFMVVMPLFFVFAVDMLQRWKARHRPRLLDLLGGPAKHELSWQQIVCASTKTFWSVFILCFVFAGLLQWVGVRLLPTLRGDLRYPMDWGFLSIISPEIVSRAATISFTGFAYLYMSICFYIFFAGLILLYTVIDDLGGIMGSATTKPLSEDDLDAPRGVVMQGVFRCSILGILVAVCMKAQSHYLVLDSDHIVTWLYRDMMSILGGDQRPSASANYSMPNSFSSLVVVVSTLVVFLVAVIRIYSHRRLAPNLIRMGLVLSALLVSYFVIGAFQGFSIIMGASAMLAVYSLFAPAAPARTRCDPAQSRVA